MPYSLKYPIPNRISIALSQRHWEESFDHSPLPLMTQSAQGEGGEAGTGIQMRLAGERANDIAPSESDSNVVALNTFVSQIFISAVDSGADDAGTSFGNFIQPEIKHKRKQLIPPASGNDMHGFVSLSLSLSCFSCLFLFPLYAFYPARFPFPVFSKFTIPRCSTVR